MKFFLFLCLLPLIGLSQTKIGDDIDGEAVNDYSGYSVSISADGNTLAIGAFVNDSGHVRVYQNISGTWTKIGNDIDGEAYGDESGRSVSLSADGSIVAIGAIYNAGNGVHSGHVRIYKNSTGIWSQVGSDIDGEKEFINSGYSVSISADGTIVAIGATGSDENGVDCGSVSIYKNIANIWTPIGLSINGEAANDYSGISTSLSADGTTVAIGAIGNDGNGADSGSVRIYKNISGTWSQIGADIDGESAGDRCGESLSISADGTTVAIGAPNNWGNGSNSGQVRVYKNIAGNWTQVGLDINGAAASDYCGKGVSISADGTVVAIGAIDVNGNGFHSGHASIYKNREGNWTQIGAVINGEADGDWSGSGISLSADGKIVAIGAVHNAGNGIDSGHVRVYDFSALLASDSFVLSRFSVYPNPTSDTIKISLQDNLTLEKVNIYNDLGQLVKTEKQNEISVSGLSKGSYFVEVITSGGKATKTIVVE